MAYRLMYEIEAHKEEVVAFCNCEEGRRFATSSFDRKIKLWQLNDALLPVVIQTVTLAQYATVLCWIPPSEEYPSGAIAAGGPATKVLIWDPSTGITHEATKGVHKNGVTGIVLDSAHNLVTSSPEGIIRKFHRGNAIGQWTVQDASIKSMVRFDEQRFLTGSTDRTIKLWTENIGAIENTYQGHQGSVQSLAVSPQGTIISGSFDGTIRTWGVDGRNRVISERPILNLTGINSIHVNPQDPQTFVVGSQDGIAEIWNLGGQSLQIMRHPGAILMLSFLINGGLVCCCSNGNIYLWTTDTTGDTYTQMEEFSEQCNNYALKYDSVKVIQGDDVLTYAKRELGSGGFGSIMKGKIPENNPYGLLAQKVAIKVAKNSIEAEIQLENEIRMLGNIGMHDNIVRLIAHGETVTGERFLVIELAKRDLSSYFKKWQFKHTFTREPNFKDLKWIQIWTIIRDLAQSLQFLHDRSIRHGDIKPANILLQQGGVNPWRAQLTDFGVACISHPNDSPPFNGEFSGGYMDPNLQRRGVREVGDDTYSFGIIALQLLIKEADPLKVRDRDFTDSLAEKKMSWIQKLEHSGCQHAEAVLDFFIGLTDSPYSPGAELPSRKAMSVVTAHIEMLGVQ